MNFTVVKFAGRTMVADSEELRRTLNLYLETVAQWFRGEAEPLLLPVSEYRAKERAVRDFRVPFYFLNLQGKRWRLYFSPLEIFVTKLQATRQTDVAVIQEMERLRAKVESYFSTLPNRVLPPTYRKGGGGGRRG